MMALWNLKISKTSLFEPNSIRNFGAGPPLSTGLSTEKRLSSPVNKPLFDHWWTGGQGGQQYKRVTVFI